MAASTVMNSVVVSIPARMVAVEEERVWPWYTRFVTVSTQLDVGAGLGPFEAGGDQRLTDLRGVVEKKPYGWPIIS